MSNACSKRNGFTLVEVLVVVIIMGILSGMGVVSFQSAVSNSRIKDAGINVTAFMLRAANEATRLNEKLCVTVASDNKTMNLYTGACDEIDAASSSPIDQFALESISEFVTGDNGACPVNTVSPYEGNSVTLTPKIGVSPIPAGCFLIKYGGSDRRASSVKLPTKFAMEYRLSYDGGETWE